MLGRAARGCGPGHGARAGGPGVVRGFVAKLQHSVSNFCWHFTPNLPANQSKHGPNSLMSYGQDGAQEREIRSTNHP